MKKHSGLDTLEKSSTDNILDLCDQIRQIAFELHSYLRHGHMEKVYENGLINRLRKHGFKVEQQYPLQVKDEDGVILGNYYVDIFVNNKLIIELKACQVLSAEHTAQVLGYLRASNCRHALLINFGSPQIQFKKLIM